MERKRVNNPHSRMVSRPKDRSLKAFREWIEEISMRLLGKVDDSISDEKWEESWKLFWSKSEDKDNGMKTSK